MQSKKLTLCTTMHAGMCTCRELSFDIQPSCFIGGHACLGNWSHVGMREAML